MFSNRLFVRAYQWTSDRKLTQWEECQRKTDERRTKAHTNTFNVLRNDSWLAFACDVNTLTHRLMENEKIILKFHGSENTSIELQLHVCNQTIFVECFLCLCLRSFDLFLLHSISRFIS